jgi:hypothetical protein
MQFFVVVLLAVSGNLVHIQFMSNVFTFRSSVAQLGADEPVSRAIILASQADKSATSSEPLRAARAMHQVA